MKNTASNIALRWLTLLAVLLNIAFNGLYTRIFNTPDIAEISRSYNDLFTPAGYVFSIWGLIYLSFVIYAIVQLLPSQRNVKIYDQLSPYLIAANILGSAWILAFTHRYILLSLIILIITLVISIVMLTRSTRAIEDRNFNRWLWVPFSLFCGWISVATIACAAVTLIDLKWDGASLTAEQWTIAMVIVAGALAIVVESRYNNFIYPLVIVWASIGIWDQRQLDHPNIGMIALVSSIFILLFVMCHALVRFFQTEGGIVNHK
ncbi:MAG: hypothetical protein HOP08_15545 [Cyclobacteriaceae bacterium]|nr:hypothetical protein [Cyclobacteriaceae bacterium]